MSTIDGDDLWAQAPRIIPVVGGPADGSFITRPPTERVDFPGLGLQRHTTVTYTVRRFVRAGDIVELLAYGDAPLDAAFLRQHGLDPV